jgi:hypothetical protein
MRAFCFQLTQHRKYNLTLADSTRFVVVLSDILKKYIPIRFESDAISNFTTQPVQNSTRHTRGNLLSPHSSMGYFLLLHLGTVGFPSIKK